MKIFFLFSLRYNGQTAWRKATISGKKNSQRITQVENIYLEILRKKQCVSLKTLAVTGKDLIQEGMQPGPGLGETLQKLLTVVLDDPQMNKKEKLLEYWKKECLSSTWEH